MCNRASSHPACFHEERYRKAPLLPWLSARGSTPMAIPLLLQARSRLAHGPSSSTAALGVGPWLGSPWCMGQGGWLHGLAVQGHPEHSRVVRHFLTALLLSHSDAKHVLDKWFLLLRDLSVRDAEMI